jgi:hypothetical protein
VGQVLRRIVQESRSLDNQSQFVGMHRLAQRAGWRHFVRQGVPGNREMHGMREMAVDIGGG